MRWNGLSGFSLKLWQVSLPWTFLAIRFDHTHWGCEWTGAGMFPNQMLCSPQQFFFFFLKAFLHVLLDVTFRTHQKWSLKLSGTTGWVKVPIQMEIKCSVDCPNCQHTYTYTPHLHIHTLTPHLTFPYHLSITVRACLIDTFLIRKTGAAYWNTYY